MTSPKTKYPIEAFGPELMTALVAGGQREVIIPFDNLSNIEGSGKRRGHKFQQRIHMLRQRMRELEHPDYKFAARARVSLFWGDRAAAELGDKFASFAGDDRGLRGAVVVIRPHDSEFSDILTKAGVTSLPQSPSGDAPLASLPHPGSYDDILDTAAPPTTPELPDETGEG